MKGERCAVSGVDLVLHLPPYSETFCDESQKDLSNKVIVQTIIKYVIGCRTVHQ